MKNETSIYPPPKKLKAFTLSEVLITLVVIGVVSAITMPILIADWQKQATISQLKKVYSTLSNAFTASIAINGPVDTWIVPSVPAQGTTLSYSKITSKEVAEEYLIPYLNVAKICKNGECNYQYTNPGMIMESGSFLDSTRYGFILADGTTVDLDAGFSNGQVIFQFKVDINGQKKPNKGGRDIFKFKTSSSGEYNGIQTECTYGAINREECLEICTIYSRSHCSGLIMADGWQIKDDYPW